MPELAIKPSVDFHVSNLGRIGSAAFDIKPLTVFIGKANTNKTWTAYALYGLLRSMSKSPRFMFGQQIPRYSAKLEEAIERIAEQTVDELLAVSGSQGSQDQQSFSTQVSRERIFQVGYPIGEYVTLEFGNEDLASLLSVESKAIGNANAILTVRTEQFIEHGCLKSLSINWQRQYWFLTGITRDDKPIHSYLISPADRPLIKAQIINSIRWLATATFEEVMAFPSERKGLAAMSWSLEKSAGPNLSIAAIDYMRFIYNIQRSSLRPQTSKVAALLEESVMNGRADFHGQPEQKIFSFLASEGPPVQMNASASFVRSMAGLDVYLRMVPGGDVIVIDEPEMNAHPEAQLKLVELFAIMANAGRYVIVTTHSPYFVDHLNNLIQGAALDDGSQVRLSGMLKLRDRQAFIQASSVSAYLFGEDGTTRNLVEDGAIDLESFAVESDYVVNLGSAIEQAAQNQDGP